MIMAYVITDVENTLSSELTAMTTKSLDQFGWSWKIWPAVNGWRITDQCWKDLGLRLLNMGKTPRRPGAQGCVLSHFTLWQHCVRSGEPMVVLEHDAVAQHAWPNDFDLDRGVCKLWSVHNVRQNTVTGTWSRGSWAYSLTVTQAQQLIDFSCQQGIQASDKQLGTNAVPWYNLDWDMFVHNTMPRLSQTASGRRYYGQPRKISSDL